MNIEESNKMKKKPFAKIYYVNSSLDYTNTICELSDIAEQIECFKRDNEDLDEAGYNEWKSKDYLPSITITIVMMTDPEYIQWFVDNVESNA